MVTTVPRSCEADRAAGGGTSDQASASSAAHEPPWAKPNRWIEDGAQPGPAGLGAVRCVRSATSFVSVAVGFGFAMTAAWVAVSVEHF